MACSARSSNIRARSIRSLALGMGHLNTDFQTTYRRKPLPAEIGAASNRCVQADALSLLSRLRASRLNLGSELTGLIYSAHPFVEINDFAPIHSRIDVANRSAFRAAQMGADFAPVPIRQGLQWQPAAVSTDFAFGRPNAIDQHSPEARVHVDGAFPITQPTCRFSTPGHRASKRGRFMSANPASPWVGN